MKSLLITLGCIACLADNAGAQSVPNISRPKAAAKAAVEATNAHTKAMTSESDSTPKRRVATDSAAGTTTVTTRSAAFERETFSYERSGRRDPFVSLMSTSELRPLITDLRVVAIAYDATGASSVAVLRDLNTKEQYRVRTGQSLGRMRVSGISQREVTFTIEEFGYSRQEVLSVSDSNTVRKQ